MAKIERGGIRLVVEEYSAFTRQLNAASASMSGFGQTAQATAAQVNAASGEYAGSRAVIEQWSETIDDSGKQAAVAAEDYTKLALGLGAIGAAGTAVVVGLGLFASRVEEVGALLEVTRRNAVSLAEAEGDMAKAAMLNTDAVKAQVQGIRDLHLSGLVATETVAALIRYNLDMTKATELARLAQDAATFAMQDSSQAVEGLIHGITTLQPRVLRSYGIMVNLNEAYRVFAAQNNLVATELTQAQRQQAAFNAVLAQAPAIAGAYEAAMSTASKQIRSLNTDIQDLSEEFGEHFTPVLDAGAGAVRDLLHWLTELPDPLQSFILYAGGVGSVLATVTSTAILLKPQLSALITGFRGLAAAAGLSSVAMSGLALGIPVVIGLIAALATKEQAHREEAAALVATSDTYDDYIQQLNDAGLEAHALVEEIYNIIKAKEEEKQAELAEGMDKARIAVEGLTKALYADVIGMDTVTQSQEDLRARQESWIDLVKGEVIPGMDAQKVALYSNVGAWRDLLAELEFAPNAAIDLAREFARLTRAQEASAEAGTSVANATSIENEILMRFTGTVHSYSDAVKEATRAELDWWTRRGDYAADYDALKDFEEKRVELIEKTGKKIVAAEQKAADARKQANVKLQDALTELEIKHSLTVAEIYDDIADLDENLQETILKNNEKRIELQIELEQRLEDIRIELARRQEDIERERLQDLEDLQREYGQKREDAARDLAQDLEDMEREHQENLVDIGRDRQEALLDLEEEYQRRLWEIENAGQLALQKLRESYAEKDSDTRLKYARRAIELMRQMGLVMSEDWQEALIRMFRTGMGPEDLLDVLPQDMANLFRDMLKELEALNEDLLWDERDLSDDIDRERDERLADLEEWLTEEQAAIERAYQERLVAEQERIAREREERQRDYDQKLEDLRRAEQREREEIERERERRLDDLRRWNEREREEAQRTYQQRLEDFERQLNDENEAARAKLQERLEDEQKSYDARRGELEREHQRRLRDIDDNEREERAKIQTNLDLKLQEYIDGYEGISFAARGGMQQMLDDTRRILPDIVEEHRKTIQEIQQAWADAGMLGQSPAPWWKAMAESWAQGVQVGFDDEAIKASVQSVIGGLQSQISGAVPAQMASMPAGMGGSSTTYSRSNQLNVTAQYQHQSEASLRDDLALYNSMLGAWGR